jgi:hypothetical protein
MPEIGPPRVKGEVFAISKSRLFLDIGKAAIAFLFVPFLFWFKASSLTVDALSDAKAIALWVMIVGLVAMGCGFLIAAIHGAVQRKRQLILGAGRLQIVDTRGVAVDIPYQNIAKAEYVPSKLLIAIELLDSEDRDTFNRSQKFAFMNKHFGFHLMINGKYETPLPTIAEKINDRRAHVRRIENEGRCS